MRLEYCDFTYNEADSGAAAFHFNTGTLSFFMCTFDRNTASQVGGAIYHSDAGLQCTGCTFSRNVALQKGGGVALMIALNEPVEARFDKCTFRHNNGNQVGGGLYTAVGYTWLGKCLFHDNTSRFQGGAIAVTGGDLEMFRCTLEGNAAPHAGGILWGGQVGEFDNTLIAFGTQGCAVGAVLGHLTSPTLSCCDLYGNAGGDWVDIVSGQELLRDNFSADPMFCGPMSVAPYLLHANSPCAPTVLPCGQVGAYGVGCGGGLPRGNPDAFDTALGRERAPSATAAEILTAGTPNPFRAETRIDFELSPEAAGKPVRLAVFDAQGRCVRTLLEGTGSTGPQSVAWDGRDRGGRRVAGGIYYYRLEAGEEQVTRRLIALR